MIGMVTSLPLPPGPLEGRNRVVIAFLVLIVESGRFKRDAPDALCNLVARAFAIASSF
jgi:hypothetical protein